jgi:hypothetical protein
MLLVRFNFDSYDTGRSSAMSVYFYQIPHHHIPGNGENLNPHATLKLIFQNIQTLLIMGSGDRTSFRATLMILFNKYRKRKHKTEQSLLLTALLMDLVDGSTCAIMSFSK